MFSNSNRYKLQADSFAPGTLSHQLYVYCSINGKQSKVKLRKTVNFYRFKEFVTSDLKVSNFNDWYFENKNSIIFLNALALHINKAENRNSYYTAPTPTMQLLDKYIAEVKQSNLSLADMLLSM